MVFEYFDLHFLLFIIIKYDMKTAQKIVNNSIKKNSLPLKISSLRYFGLTHLCKNAHFTYKILQYTCFNCTCYTCSNDKRVWDMSQCNKLSNIQYARFQILPVDLHFGLFWSADIPTMNVYIINKYNHLRHDWHISDFLILQSYLCVKLFDSPTPVFACTTRQSKAPQEYLLISSSILHII